MRRHVCLKRIRQGRPTAKMDSIGFLNGTPAHSRRFSNTVVEKKGIAFWIEQVVRECDRVSLSFAPEPVHDLRVALRHCRSIASGFMFFDPHCSWKEVRKEGARLFNSLGELRDIHMMIERLMNPEAPRDNTSNTLIERLAGRECELKKTATAAVKSFNRRKWTARIALLSERASRIPVEGDAFRHLALERWQQTYSLHRRALRNHSQTGYHRLRIELKKFRYTLENFLPGLYMEWEADLRSVQDLLGEVNDLYVLRRMLSGPGIVQNQQSLELWNSWIEEEIRKRIGLYRQQMTGRKSQWSLWRAGLPAGEQLKSAALESLEKWASFRDQDWEHSKRVARLALQIYDSLASQRLLGGMASEESRSILHIAVLLQGIGSTTDKSSYRTIRNIEPPAGLPAEYFRMAALVVRYYLGRPSGNSKNKLKHVAEEQQRLAKTLAGITQLAFTLNTHGTFVQESIQNG
jgi:CHAD domain-containing protein